MVAAGSSPPSASSQARWLVQLERGTGGTAALRTHRDPFLDGVRVLYVGVVEPEQAMERRQEESGLPQGLVGRM